MIPQQTTPKLRDSDYFNLKIQIIEVIEHFSLIRKNVAIFTRLNAHKSHDVVRARGATLFSVDQQSRTLHRDSETKASW